MGHMDSTSLHELFLPVSKTKHLLFKKDTGKTKEKKLLH